jgi:hypothetical protein
MGSDSATNSTAPGAGALARGRLRASDLMPLEQYARSRVEFRARVLAHKKPRQIQVGPNTTWLFEDRLTVQYQIQEMLRTERIFEPQGIADELEAYNPLIPDGRNWKVTLLVEFPDPEQRRLRLAELKGIEDRCWVRVEGCARVFAIADEDLDRENDEKTSSVHFLRFELDDGMARTLRGGAALALGVDHAAYRHEVEPLPDASRLALLRDLA